MKISHYTVLHIISQPLSLSLSLCLSPSHSVYHTSSSPSPSPSHEALTESIGGGSANLSRSTRSPSYLTLKRGLLYGHNNAITGLCVIMPAKVKIFSVYTVKRHFYARDKFM